MPPMRPEHPIQRWFASRDWAVFDFQRAAWDAYLSGRSGLIHAPTGTGKTLAAWFGPVLEALQNPPVEPPPLTVLWITPLRALAADTTAHLAETATELGLPWTIERRTGDTSSATRSRQRRRLPSALVTTPESLSLQLSYSDAHARFRHLRCVVVDEWHELMGSKRGVQLELCLAHLRTLCPGLQTWGLSATLGNLDEAREVLLGPDQSGDLIQGLLPKRTAIDAVIPERMERFPWAGHLGTNLVHDVLAALDRADTSLLFTNTRSQAELWHQALLQARPDWFDQIALHHGSLDRSVRDQVEVWLRAGAIRCVVATSSLDLGVDFTPVDQVLQVGSPKGVARLVQRAGRSGHQPGAESAVLCVPTHAFELVEIAAARDAAVAGEVEARPPLRGCLDVLVQHLVTLALGPGFTDAAQLAEVRATHAYAGLSERQWRWLLDFITTGGSTFKAYPQYRRVERDGDVFRVTDATIGRRHRMAVGTITADSMVRVKYQRGGLIGFVEEAFIARLKPGEQFLFSGRALELVRVRDMTAQVRSARGRTRAVPRWMGGRMPLSTRLADGVGARLEQARDGHYHGLEMTAVRPVLEAQRSASALPGRDELLVERIRSREGQHLFVYPFAGRLVHEALSALVAWRLTREAPATFGFSMNDYGFELVSRRLPEVDGDVLARVLSPDSLEADLRASLNAAEMVRRHFREIARIAGLVFEGYPGRGKSTRQVQASSGLIFDVLHRYDADHPLLAQAEQEVLESQLELGRLRDLLRGLQARRLLLTRPRRLTPLAFPLWVSRVQSRVSSEDWQTRVQRMLGQLERQTPDA